MINGGKYWRANFAVCLTSLFTGKGGDPDAAGADPGILEGGWLDLGLIKRGGCGRGMCPLPREARKFFTEDIDILCMKTCFL